MQQRAQEAFAVMQATAAPAALLQLCIVGIRDGWHGPEIQARLLINIGLCVLMAGSLLLFTRPGRVLGAARFSAMGMLLFDLGFAYAYGLRGTPTPYVLTLALIAIIALVETPRMLAVWSALFGSVMVYGLLGEPRWVFAPNPISLASGVVFTLGFFTLFLVEFRATMSDAIANVRAQAATLATANSELRETIEERDRLSDQLATAQRVEAMGRLAGSIAHDFNNLLTVIRGYADLIAEDTPRHSARRAEVDHLVNAVSRASRVTREVLDFAAPRPIATQPTDLSAFLRELAPSLRTLVSPRNVLVLETTTRDVFCMADVDRAQLERVVMNLATNARDVTPAGGVIRIELGCNAERVQCRVIDGGPGVDVELRERIFEPFFTTKGTTGGTGLGLASAFTIVRQHGGAITVGDAPEGGAVFTVDLPRSVNTLPIVPNVTPHRPSPVIARPLDGLNVVLVEDDPSVQRLASRLLQRAGGRVTAFDNSADAVTHLKSTTESDASVDLVVTDLRLPGGSGSDVIAAARARTPSIAIVAVSGFLDDEGVAESAARQELHFLPKPFSEQHLLDAIASARRYAMA